jgi:pimeloyl-ACP methyl ester carboxylesterase
LEYSSIFDATKIVVGLLPLHYYILILCSEVSNKLNEMTSHIKRKLSMNAAYFHVPQRKPILVFLSVLLFLISLPVTSLFAQTDEPTAEPTIEITVIVTSEPTDEATEDPTSEPTSEETLEATPEETAEMTVEPTAEETSEVTQEPTGELTAEPTAEATDQPTAAPTLEPTAVPTTIPVEVEAEASDDLILRGSYYAVADSLLPDTGAPAVLLLHMNNSTRAGWQPAIQPLVDAGYNVLAVDMRGFGETDGDVDFDLALIDVQTWLDWLRSQPEVDPAFVSVMGASIGANLALVGCGNDADCVTAIALSPGLAFFDIRPGDILNETLRDRAILLIVSQLDSESIVAVEEFFTTARGEVAARIFTGSSHGTNLFLPYGDRLTPFIIAWLDEQVNAKLKTITGS